MPQTGAANEVFADFFVQNQDQLIKRWVDLVQPSLRRRLTEAELARQLRDLAGAVASMLEQTGGWNIEAAEAAELRALLTELSRNQARRGFSTNETATCVFAVKDAALDMLDLAAGQDARDLLSGFTAFSRFVDQMGLLTFEAYARTREELISEQTEQLLELSTPVVKLWDGVLAVPLVGTLDSSRAQTVMEKLLQMLVDTGSAYAIIDITGVPAVDTQVAQHVLKTVVAARLMGAECVISGIRPQIAQTIVALGIEFGDIVTKASLADALVHALGASGVEMVRRGRADRLA